MFIATIATATGLMPSRPRRSATAPAKMKPTIMATAMISKPLATPARSYPAMSRSHGPAHRLCTARNDAWVVKVAGATLQKTGLVIT